MILPHVLPFIHQGLGWEFVDQRSVGSEDGAAKTINRAWTFHVSRTLKEQGLIPKDLICGLDEDRPRRNSLRLGRVRARGESIDTPEMNKRGTNRERVTDPDPDMTQLMFGIRRVSDGQWIGGLSISNATVTAGTRGRLNLSGLLLIGAPDGGNPLPIWVQILRDVMNRSLPLVDGRNLEIIEYQFLGAPESRAQVNRVPLYREFIEALRPHFIIRGGRPGFPITRTVLIRRRGVPSTRRPSPGRPPSGEVISPRRRR